MVAEKAVLTYLMMSLQSGPDTAEALYYVGQSYKMMENSTDAIIWFTRVITEFPEDPFAEMAKEARDG